MTQTAPAPPAPLTPRQERILDAIRDVVRGRGYPPTMRELGSAVGLASASSVANQLRQLERLGYIRRGPGPRAIELVDLVELDAVAAGVTDPRWPSIRFKRSETDALVELYKAAGELGCDAATRHGDPDREPCLPCWIAATALYASPAVYARLEPTLPRHEGVTTEEPPF